MDAFLQKYYRIIARLILIAVIFAIIYVSVKYLLPFLAPFIIAVAISIVNEPIISFLENKLKIHRKIGSIVSLLLTISIFGVALTYGIIKIYNELVILQNNLATYIDATSEQIMSYFTKATAYYNNLPVDITNAIDESLKSLAPQLQGIIQSLVGYLINTVKSVPKITVFIIVTLISTYFINSDKREIRKFIYKQMPESMSRNFHGIKTNTFAALFGYFKALLMLMGLTFIEVSTGLFILRMDYALLMGLLVAISDAIPVLGTGLIMVPWILWNVITGNMRIAFGLAIIYLIGVIVRQILEPKLVGNQIGLHPLVTLIAMYVGLSLFGVLGMVIGPVSIIVLKNLQKLGLLRLWND